MNETLTQNLSETRTSIMQKDIILNTSKEKYTDLSDQIQVMQEENSRLKKRITTLTDSYEQDTKSLKDQINEGILQTRTNRSKNLNKQDSLSKELKKRIEELQQLNSKSKTALKDARVSHEKEIAKYKSKLKEALASQTKQKHFAPVNVSAPSTVSNVDSDVVHLKEQPSSAVIVEKTMKSFRVY